MAGNGIPHIHCRECNSLIPAEWTHNGLCGCWLGHCCGFGQAAYKGEEVYIRDNKEAAEVEQ